MFAIHRQGDHVIVIPTDIAPRIAAGEIDPDLFDVTTLLADGYGDGERDDLPLIITGVADPVGLQPRFAPRGMTAARALPGLHMLTMRQPKASPGAALASLQAVAPRTSASTAPATATKIWLDGKRKLLDDQSLHQIGGDVAHARGLTGTGITVAVIDSGIDVTHPDLVGKVIASQDFTGDGQGTIDVEGHGTHVAGIIAGTGAASAGRFQGVAPDAQLINARVCEATGCPDSAILAGMEWAAVDQNAKIINMSLGGPDSPGLDPIELAVDQLSADRGALFVIAAGNAGIGATLHTIESPGSADAALTVGAVDANDQRAVFSSVGPRLGDEAIKPDITAPGVDIISARAHNILLGTPFDANYTILSGTSMSTPHVAGAAALLLQEHPGWTGAQLKAHLMATAQPNPRLSVFAQGAGRVDLDRATRQAAIVASPPSLSFGTAVGPHDHDPPIVRTASYHNGGAAPITLALAAGLAAPDGSAATSRLTLSATSLTIPAGGDAAVTVTIDISGPGVDGLYSGVIVATSGDVRVETPIGVDREVPSGNVTFHVRDEAGAPAGITLSLVTAGSRSSVVRVADGDVVRLPDGLYDLSGMIDNTFDFMVDPFLQVTGDTTLTFDARQARPAVFDVGDAGVHEAGTEVAWINGPLDHEAGFLSGNAPGLKFAQVGADAPPGDVLGWVTQYQSDAPFAAATRVYGFAHAEQDHIPTGWSERVPRAKLATVDFEVAARADEVYTAGTALLPQVTPQNILAFAIPSESLYAGPSRRTERYYAPGFEFEVQRGQRVTLTDGEFDTARSCSEHLYLPGHHYREAWNRAAFGPALPDAASIVDDTLVPVAAARRTGDLLSLNLPLLGGQTAPQFVQVCQLCLLAPEHVELFFDGVPLYQLDGFSGDVLPALPVPADAATYRFERSIQLDPSVVALSTEVDAAWTFTSQHVDGAASEPLPLIAMRFQPPVDDHNEVHARAIALPIHFDRPLGVQPQPIVKTSLDVSFNDGRSWITVPVIPLGDQALAIIVHPPGAQLVSLRATAADRDGNQIEQTIIRAYPVVP
jgi:subtilisin family serine protease